MKNKISTLLKEISVETSCLSFHIDDHPKLLKIVAFGEDAVPILLDHLCKSRDAELAKYEGYEFHDYAPWYAILALGKITGEFPIKPENAGRLFGIIEDWLRWSKFRKGDFDIPNSCTKLDPPLAPGEEKFCIGTVCIFMEGHTQPCKDGSEYQESYE